MMRRGRHGARLGASPARAAVVAVALTALAGALGPAAAQPAAVRAADAGPRFRADGPDADAFGRGAGYPACEGLSYVREQRCRIGAFSHYDALFPSRIIRAARTPSPLGRAAGEPAVRYTHGGQTRAIDDYLDRHPVTGFLVAKGESILVERYQYARTDAHRLTSFSMAKTIVGLLVGIALHEGAIRSADDEAAVYAPRLGGTEYGRTPIRALLRMASGVAFQEVYTDMASDIAKLAFATLGQDPGGSVAALRQFNTRVAPPGERFSYSSAESLVLGLVLAGATRRTVSDYASEKLWQPLGAEADATWSIDATGQEITYAYFNAVLRDWARLGLMLAHDGTWRGRSIVPRSWAVEATTPGAKAPSAAYGYHVWLLSGPGRAFALRGLRGQVLLVDPAAKLVLVQTAARTGSDPLADQELLALWSALRSELR